MLPPQRPGPLPLRASPRGTRDPTASVVQVFIPNCWPQGQRRLASGGPSWAFPVPARWLTVGLRVPPPFATPADFTRHAAAEKARDRQELCLPAGKTTLPGAPSAPWFPPRTPAPTASAGGGSGPTAAPPGPRAPALPLCRCSRGGSARTPSDRLFPGPPRTEAGTQTLVWVSAVSWLRGVLGRVKSPRQ